MTTHIDHLRAAFGLVDPPRDTFTRQRAAAARAAAEIDRALKPGQIALITGPSGSGKSLILRALSQRTPTTAATSRSKAPTTIDAIARALRTTSTRRAMAHMSRVGLADATLAHIPPRHLSDGQRFRLALALALVRPTGTIVVDEFCSTLDRLTAIGVCLCLRRTLGQRRLVCATARDEVLEWLAPEVLVVQGLHVGAAVFTVDSLHHRGTEMAQRKDQRKDLWKVKAPAASCLSPLSSPLCDSLCPRCLCGEVERASTRGAA